MADQSPQTDNPGSPRPASLVDMITEPLPVKAGWSPSRPAILAAAALGGLLVFINRQQFPLMLDDWIDDPNWSHGFLIPLFSLYLLYARRQDLLAVPRQACLWGLPVLVAACAMQVVGYWIGNPFTIRVSLVGQLFGLVLYLGGPGPARVTWLPIFFLLFAVKIPDIVYGSVSYPLQNVAARGSAVLLRIFGVRIAAVQSNLEIVSLTGESHSLTVAEACSGMRLLMAFMALGVAMAYLEERPIWQRVVLVLLGIPVAILCNVIRVAITCEMYVLDRPDLGRGFMHEFTGMLMLIPAFAILWLIGRLMQSLFVEVEEQKPGPQAGPTE
jgi:exosortase